MENKKVYIVTSGDYSDYSIDAVFSTMEMAEEYLDTRDSNSRIETFEIDKPTIKNETLWKIYFSKNGDVVDIYKDYPEKEKDSDIFHYDSQRNMLGFVVKSDSKARAVKIASERRAFVLSNKYLFPLLFVQCVKFSPASIPYTPSYHFNTGELLKFDYYLIQGKWLHLAQVLKNPNSTEEEFNEAAIELGLKQKPTPKRDVKVIEILPGKGEKE